MVKKYRSVPSGMRRTWCAGTLLVMAGVVTSACGSAQLLAPTSSTITVSAPTRVASGSSTEITAFVLEQGGTPVQNGTTVRFSTTLGRVDPVEVETENGLAVTVFFADGASGLAEIRATSGAAGGGEGTTNVVQITVGAAAVNTVTLRANPGSVGPGGGSVQLSATVVGVNGEALSAVGVTFNTDQGTLSPSTVTTDGNGEALTTLTTSQQAIVSATAGVTTSSPVTITVRAGPIVTIACAPAAGTGSCAAAQADTTNNTATVVFTITKPSASSTLSTATLDFGDGTSLHTLGDLAGGTATSPRTATATRTYDGPAGATAVSYTAMVTVTDINGETSTATTVVVVTPRAARPQLIATLSATLGTAVLTVGQPVTFTATVTPATDGADLASNYAWTFGDSTSANTSGNATAHVYTSNGIKTATVTVTTTDGRTATARVEFIISGV